MREDRIGLLILALEYRLGGMCFAKHALEFGIWSMLSAVNGSYRM